MSGDRDFLHISYMGLAFLFDCMFCGLFSGDRNFLQMAIHCKLQFLEISFYGTCVSGDGFLLIVSYSYCMLWGLNVSGDCILCILHCLQTVLHNTRSTTPHTRTHLTQSTNTHIKLMITPAYVLNIKYKDQPSISTKTNHHQIAQNNNMYQSKLI